MDGDRRVITLDEARERLEQIRLAGGAGDDEVAHSREDKLHQAVLEAVADSSPDSVELAVIALRTKEMDYARWCA